MPKKSRRTKAKRRARPAKVIQGEYSQSLSPAAVEPQLAATVSPKDRSSIDRYQYLMPELRRIGILAGAIILILIVLSFVLS